MKARRAEAATSSNSGEGKAGERKGKQPRVGVGGLQPTPEKWGHGMTWIRMEQNGKLVAMAARSDVTTALTGDGLALHCELFRRFLAQGSLRWGLHAQRMPARERGEFFCTAVQGRTTNNRTTERSKKTWETKRRGQVRHR